MKSCCDEYCSTHGCNQGRDCPVRVARIGRRHPASEPLPPSAWREQLKQLAKWVLRAIVLLMFAMAIAALFGLPPSERKADCSLASFHPDMSKQDREQCRRRL